MSDIDKLMTDTLCSKFRAESVLKSSTSYEAALRTIRLLQNSDANNTDCE